MQKTNKKGIRRTYASFFGGFLFLTVFCGVVGKLCLLCGTFRFALGEIFFLVTPSFSHGRFFLEVYFS